jgi:hypothetical protein
VACAAALLAACGSDSPTAAPAASSAHGTLAVSPPLRIASVDAATFQAQLGSTASGAQLLQIAGAPTCGVDFYYITFWTVGALGETTKSSGALMVPTGAAPGCSGPRPIVLYGHGTQFEKSFNIADATAFTTTNAEGAVLAATFAAQGYIVVAPNYAGYDISTLGYHPFLNATQQSGEMIDALTAGRAALPTTFAASTSDNGQLFITGYSAGGYVAMATQRAMEATGQTSDRRGTDVRALRARGAVRRGRYRPRRSWLHVIFTAGDHQLSACLRQRLHHAERLLLGDLRHRYRYLDADHRDAIHGTVHAGPAAGPGAVRQHHAGGHGAERPHAVDRAHGSAGGPDDQPGRSRYGAVCAGLRQSLSDQQQRARRLHARRRRQPRRHGGRVAALAAVPPTYGLRLDLYKNDMRNGSWAPNSPTLLCGGENDPTIFFSVDTLTMAAFWSGLPANLVTVLDVDPAAGPSGPFAAIQAGFQQSQLQLLAYLQTPAGGGMSLAGAQQALLEEYHGTSVPPFCSLAARTFFSQF